MGTRNRTFVVAQLLAATSACAPTPSTSIPPVARSVDSVRAIPAPHTTLPSESQSAAVTRFSFIAYGDTRGRHDGQALAEEHGRVVSSMLTTIAERRTGADPIRFVVSSGDAVVDGRDARQWNVSFVDVLGRLTTQGDVPVFPSPGNHDVAHTMSRDAPDRLQALGHYFAAFRAFIPPDGSPRRLAGYPTFAFGYGNTFVLSIDSNIADDSTQYRWVRAQLEALDRRRFPNIVVVQHHPAYSSGPHGGRDIESQTRAVRNLYMPLFRKHRVRLLLAGHEHLFEHWVERYRDAGQSYRFDEIVSGGGGAPLYQYVGEPDLRAYLQSDTAAHIVVEHLVRPSPRTSDNSYHYLIVTVDGAHVRVEVIGVDAGPGFHPYGDHVADLSDGT